MKRVLVAHDLSQRSAGALLRALRLAAKYDCAIRLIHCTDDAGDLGTRPSERSRLLGEAQIMAEEIDLPLVDISARIACGNAAEAILSEAESIEADLIIMGGHGAPRFRDAVFGTTASHVIRHASCPVLIVQNLNQAANYSDMMVAIDDPLDAETLLSEALAIAPSAKLVAVHAFSPTMVQLFVGSDELEHQEGRLRRQIKAAVAAVTGEEAATSASSAFEVIVETGEVLEVLTKAYESRQPSLLVMGTRARSTFLGSHAVDALFCFPNDVLVIPDRAKQTAPDISEAKPIASRG